MIKNIYIYISIVLLFTINTYAKRDTINFSMVISGGVSLGAYEAGYNWTTIKILSAMRDKNPHLKPNLSSVAGASAGSINALISTIYWCQKESIPLKNSIDDNLFYDTWVNLGIEDLAIIGEDSQNHSTLFTRKALKKKAQNLVDHMNKPIFRKGCEVPLGVSVTKATPTVEYVAGIKIKNQHFSIPLDIQEHNKKLIIKNKKMPPSTDFYISIPGIEHDTSKISKVLFASSAFPGAFEQVKLEYIYKGKKASHYFIDGGAYDNIPLQLAIELAPKASLFFFIDPSNMRKETYNSQDDTQKEQPPVGFFTSNALPLMDSLEIFQSMRLYQAVNKYFRNNKSRRLVISSRFHPLVGNYLWHFAAFLNKNFRIYDYYVGVYDAIYNLASSLRKKTQYKHFSQSQLMDILVDKLEIDKNKEAFLAYKMLKKIEFQHIKPKTTNRFSTIYNAFDLTKPDAKRYTLDDFKAFLQKLDMKYLQKYNNAFLTHVKKDINHWYKMPLRVIINRITTLENDRAKVYPNYKTVATTTNLGAWAVSSFVAKKDGWDILPLHVPQDKGKEGLRTALRLLPGEMAIDMKNGGGSLGYTALYHTNWQYLSGIEAKASYVFAHQDSDFIRMDMDLFYNYDDFVKFGIGASGFGDMKGSFYKKDSAYGINTYIDLMDIFRITYVNRHGSLYQSNYLYFGIENIPALIYWLNR